jgi:hypothetical protein
VARGCNWLHPGLIDGGGGVGASSGEGARRRPAAAPTTARGKGARRRGAGQPAGLGASLAPTGAIRVAGWRRARAGRLQQRAAAAMAGRSMQRRAEGREGGFK